MLLSEMGEEGEKRSWDWERWENEGRDGVLFDHLLLLTSLGDGVDRIGLPSSLHSQASTTGKTQL